MTTELNKLLASLSKFADDNEKIFIPTLSFKLSSALKQYPEDQTIGMVAQVISKMAGNSKLEITRSEFKDLYNKFYTRNNKFASVFAEELNVAIEKEVNQPKTPELDGSMLGMGEIVSAIDPVLAGACNAAFGGSSNIFKESHAPKAVAACKKEFAWMGLPVSLTILAGKADVLVCSASFETPKGETSVLVPVEIVADEAVTPTFFVGNDGAVDLNRENVVAYVRANAGKKLTVTAGDLIQVASNIKNSSEIYDVDLALIKIASSNAETYAAPQIIGQKLEKEAAPLLKSSFMPNKDVDSFVNRFNSEAGIAVSRFGQGLINKARSVIASVLNESNIENYNVNLLSSTDDSISYAVSVNNGQAGFSVDINIQDGNIIPPQTVIASGSLKSFDAQGIGEIISGELDKFAAAKASVFASLNSDDLVSTIRTAVKEQNYARAEDALNVLAESGDEKSYQAALSVFANGLKNQSETKELSKCSMVVRSKHSQHDLCGHTGLPVHKVYQNKLGECLPLYRKNMQEGYEGATFMNSKLYL